jgi:hypothetical protein
MAGNQRQSKIVEFIISSSYYDLEQCLLVSPSNVQRRATVRGRDASSERTRRCKRWSDYSKNKETEKISCCSDAQCKSQASTRTEGPKAAVNAANLVTSSKTVRTPSGVPGVHKKDIAGAGQENQDARTAERPPVDTRKMLRIQKTTGKDLKPPVS